MLRAIVFLMGSLSLFSGILAIFLAVTAVSWVVFTLLHEAYWLLPQQQQAQGEAQGHSEQNPAMRGIVRAGAR